MSIKTAGTDYEVKRHTVGRSIGLHLIPGALITIFAFLVAPPIMRAGWPALMALLLAILFVLVPVELGYLLYEGWKKHGRLTLEGVVLYREPIPTWQYFVFVPLFIVWGFIWFGALAPVDEYLANTVFYWMPAWTAPAAALENLDQYSQSVLVTTFLLGLALNGIVGPLVEELYFRGYLLPRIDYLKKWAPLLNVVLFSLYHFFSPWQNLTRIIALLPVVYAVAWKRNIYLSILTHIGLNTIGMLLTLALLLQ